MINRFITPVLALLAVAGIPAAQASDPAGNYIVRGIGARPCSDYLKAVGQSPEAVSPYLSWMEGYLTGINRLQPETFDVSPVTSAAVVAQLVVNTTDRFAFVSQGRMRVLDDANRHGS